MTKQDAQVIRKPGRPPQTDEDIRRAREHILKAATDVFGEFGYHGVNVARIIDRAQIARPTFYRYFRNADEAVGLVLGRIGRDIGTKITAAVVAADGAIPKLVAGVDAYFQWSQQNQPLLRSIYSGSHDPSNPVYPLRPILIQQLTDVINHVLVTQGRPTQDVWTMDLFINAMEYACYRLYQQPDLTQDVVDHARATIFRTALALLGGSQDWQNVMETPEVSRQLFTKG